MKTLFFVAFFCMAYILPFAARAQNNWVSDNEMKFKIRVPNSYKQNQFRDGSDKIYAFVSHDENVAVRVRSMRASEQFTSEILQQVFEQNIISGATRIMNNKGDLHGIPATASAYTWKYNNIETVIGAYYIIQNGFAYVVWTIVPRNLINQRSAEADAIIDSFELLDENTGTSHSYLSHKKEVQIEKLEVGEELNSSLQIVQAKNLFYKNVSQINAGFTYSGNPEGDNFQLKWFSENYKRYFYETSLTAPQLENGRGYGFINNQGQAWPTGNYRVEVWFKNQKLGSRSFQIN